MADEIQITKTLSYSNGQLKYTYQPGTIRLPQAASGYLDRTISVTTAEVAVTTSNLGTPGITLLRNLEATTTGKAVSWGPQTSTGGLLKLGVLKAKQTAEFTYNTSATVLRLQGNTTGATVKVQFLCFEN